MRIRPLFFGWMILSHLVAWGNPHNPKVVSGEAAFKTKDSSLEIMASDRAVINWDKFSIAPNEKASFVLPSKDAAVLNRVTSNMPSRIEGLLHSNGHVYLINPNGVLVTESGYIDTASFLASTLDIHNADFLKGVDLLFAGNSKEAIINKGVIKAWNGDVVLLGYQIRNEGEINAPAGVAALGVGREILVAPNADQRITIHIPVPSSEEDSLEVGIDQQGMITAIQTELKADGNPYALAIQSQGVIHASSVDKSGGRIFLVSDKGVTSHSGTLIAAGGEIQILGEVVAIEDGATIDTSSNLGGGNIYIGGGYQGQDAKIVNAKHTFVAQDVRITADAIESGNGGQVVVWSDENTNFFGIISSRGGALGGNGGDVEVSSHHFLGFHGFADRSAVFGQAGTLLLDPSDITISNAADANIMGAPNFTSAGPTGNISVPTLLANLAGGSVSVSTAAGAGGNGDISILDNITWNVGMNTLTLNAFRDINIDAGVIFTNTVGSIAMNAGLGTDGTIFTDPTSSLVMSGTGTLALVGNNTSISDAIDLQGTITYTSTGAASITANDGSISISGGGIGLNTVAALTITTSNTDDILVNAPIVNISTGQITVTSGQDVNMLAGSVAQISSAGVISITAANDVNVIAEQVSGGDAAFISAGAGPSNVTATAGTVRVVGYPGGPSATISISDGDLTVSAGTDIDVLTNATIESTSAMVDTLTVTATGNLNVFDDSAIQTTMAANLSVTAGGNVAVQAGANGPADVTTSTGTLTLSITGDLDLASSASQAATISSASNTVTVSADNVRIIGAAGQNATIEATDADLTLTCNTLDLDTQGHIDLLSGGMNLGTLTVTVNAPGTGTIRNFSQITSASDALIAANLSFASDLTISGGALGTSEISVTGAGDLLLSTLGIGDLFVVNNAEINATGGGAATITVAGSAFFAAGAGPATFTGGMAPVLFSVVGNLYLLSDDNGQSFITSMSDLDVTATENIYIIGQPGANSAFISTTSGLLNVAATSGNLELTNEALIQLTGGIGALSFSAGNDLTLHNFCEISSASATAATGTATNNIFLIGGTNGDTQISTTGALTLTATSGTGSINLQAASSGQAFITMGDGPGAVTAGMSGKVNLIGQASGVLAYIESTSPLSTLTVTGAEVQVLDQSQIRMTAATTGLLTVTASSGDLRITNGSRIENAGTGGISSTTTSGTLYVEGGPSAMGAAAILAGAGGATITADAIAMSGYSSVNDASIVATGGNLTVTASLALMSLVDFSSIILTGGGNLDVEVMMSDLIVANTSTLSNTGAGTTLVNVPIGAIELLGGSGPGSIVGGTMGTLTVTAGSNIRMIADIAGETFITSSGADIDVTSTGASVFVVGAPGAGMISYIGNSVPFMGSPVGEVSVTANDHIIIRDSGYISIGMGGVDDINLSTAIGDLDIQNNSSILNSGTGAIIANIPGVEGNVLVRGGPNGSAAIQADASGITLTMSNGNLNVEAVNGGSATISAAGTSSITTGMFAKMSIMGYAMAAAASITNSVGDLTISTGSIDMKDFASIDLSSAGGTTLSVTTQTSDLRIENASTITHSGMGGIISGSVAQILLLQAGTDGTATITGADGGTTLAANTLLMTGVSVLNDAEITATGGLLSLTTTDDSSLNPFAIIHLTGGTGDLTMSVGGDLVFLDGSLIQTDSTMGTLAIDVTGAALIGSASTSVLITSTMSTMASHLIAGGTIDILADATGSATVSAVGPFTLQSTGESIHFIGSSTGGQVATVTTSSGALSVLAAEHITLYDNAAISLTAGAGTLTVTATAGDLIVDNNSNIEQQGTGPIVAIAGGNAAVKASIGGGSSIATNDILTMTVTGNLDVEATSDGAATISSAGPGLSSIAVTGMIRMNGFPDMMAPFAATIVDSDTALSVTGSSIEIANNATIQMTDPVGVLSVVASDADIVIYNAASIDNDTGLITTVTSQGSVFVLGGPNGAASILPGTAAFMLTITAGDLKMIADVGGTADITAHGGVNVDVIAGNILLNGFVGGPQASITSDAVGFNMTIDALNNVDVHNNATIAFSNMASTGTIAVTATDGDLTIENEASIINTSAGMDITVASTNGSVILRAGSAGSAVVEGLGTLSLTAGDTIKIEAASGFEAHVFSSGDTTLAAGGEFHMSGFDTLVRASIVNNAGFLSINADGVTTLYPHSSILLTSGMGAFTMVHDDDFVMGDDTIIRNSSTGPLSVNVAGSATIVAGAGNAIVEGVVSTVSFTTTKNLFVLADMTGFSQIISGSDLSVDSGGSISVIGSISGPNTASLVSANAGSGFLDVTAATDITIQDGGRVHALAGALPVTVTATGGNINLINDANIEHVGTGTVTVDAGADILVKAGPEGDSYILGPDTVTVTGGGDLDIFADSGGAAYIQGGDTTTVTVATGRLHIAGHPLVNEAYIQTTDGDVTVTAESFDLIDFASINLLGGMGTMTLNDTIGEFRVSNLSFIRNLGTGATDIAVANSVFLNGGSDGQASIIYTTGTLSLGSLMTPVAGNIYLQADLNGAATIEGDSTLTIVTDQNVSLNGTPLGAAAQFIITDGDLFVSAGGQLATRDNASLDITGGTGTLTLTTLAGDIVVENDAFARTLGTGAVVVNSAANLEVRTGSGGSAFISGNDIMSIDAAGSLIVETLAAGGGIARINSSGDTTVSADTILVSGYSLIRPAFIQNDDGLFDFDVVGNISLNPFGALTLTGGTGTFSVDAGGDLIVINGSSITSASTMGTLDITIGGTSNIASGASTVLLASSFTGGSFVSGGSIFILADASGSASVNFAGALNVTSVNESIHLIGSQLGGQVAEITNSAGALIVAADQHITLYDSATIETTAGAGLMTVTATNGDLLVDNGSNIVHLGTGAIVASSGGNALVKGGLAGDSSIATNDSLTFTVGGSLDIQAVATGDASILANGTSTITVTDKIKMSGFSLMEQATILNSLGDLTVTGAAVEMIDFSSISLTDVAAGMLIVNSTAFDLVIYNNSFIQNLAAGGTTTNSFESIFILGGPDGPASILPGTGAYILSTAAGNLNMIADVGGGAFITANGSVTIDVEDHILINGFVGMTPQLAAITTDATLGNLDISAGGNINVQNHALVSLDLASTGDLLVLAGADLTVENDAELLIPGVAGDISLTATTGNVIVRSGPAGIARIAGNDELALVAGGALEIESFSGFEASIESDGHTDITVGGELHMAGFGPLVRARLENGSGHMFITVGGVTTIYPHSTVMHSGGVDAFTMTLGDDFVLGDDSIVQSLSSGPMSIDVTGSATLVAGAGNAIVEGTFTTMSFITTKNIFVLADQTGFSEIHSFLDLTVTSMEGSISVLGSLAGSNTASIHNDSGFLTLTAATDVTLQDFGSIFTLTGAMPLTVTATAGNVNINNASFISHLDVGAVTVNAGADILVKAGFEGASFIAGNFTVDVTSSGNLDIEADLGGEAYIEGGDNTTVLATAGRIRIAGNSIANTAYIQTIAGDLTVTGQSFDLLDFASINQLGATGLLTINDTLGDFRVSNFSFVRNNGSGTTTINALSSLFLTGGLDGEGAIVYNTGVFNLNVTGNIDLQADLIGGAYITGNADLTIVGLNNINIVGEPSGPAAYMTTTAGNIAISAANQIVVRDNAFIDLTGGAGTFSVNAIASDLVVENAAYLRNQVGNVQVTAGAGLAVRAGAAGDAFVSSAAELLMVAGGLLDVVSQTNFTGSILSNGNTVITALDVNMTGMSGLFEAAIINTVGDLLLFVGNNVSLNPFARIHLSGGVDDFALLAGGDLVVINGSNIISNSLGGLMSLLIGGTSNIASGASSVLIASTASVATTFSAGGSIFILADGSGSAAVQAAGALTVTSVNESIHLLGSLFGGQTASITTTAGALTVTADQHITLYDSALIAATAGSGLLTVTATNGDLLVDNGSNIAQQGTGAIVAAAGGNAMVKGGLAGDSAIATNDTLNMTVGGSLDVQAVATGAATITSNGTTFITVTDKIKISGFSFLEQAMIINSLDDLTVTGSAIEMLDFASINLTDVAAGILTVTSTLFDILIYNNSFIQNLAAGGTTTDSFESFFILGGPDGPASILPGTGAYFLTTTSGNLNMVADVGGGAFITANGPVTIDVADHILMNGYVGMAPQLAAITTDSTLGNLDISAGGNINVQNHALISLDLASTGDLLVLAGADLTVENDAELLAPGVAGDISLTATTGNVIVRSGPAGIARIAGNDELALVAGGALEIESFSGFEASIESDGHTDITVGGEFHMAGFGPLVRARLENGSGHMFITVGGVTTIYPHSTVLHAGGVDPYTMLLGDDFVLGDDSIIQSLSTGLMTIDVTGSATLVAGAGNAIVVGTLTTMNFTTTKNIFVLADETGFSEIHSFLDLTVTSTGGSISALGSLAGANTASIHNDTGFLTLTAATDVTLQDFGSIYTSLGAMPLSVTATAGNVNINNASFITHLGTGSVTVDAGADILIKAGFEGAGFIAGSFTVDVTSAGNLDIEADLGGEAYIEGGDTTNVLATAGRIRIAGNSIVNTAYIQTIDGDLNVTGQSFDLLDFASINQLGATGLLNINDTLGDLRVSNFSFVRNNGTGITNINALNSLFVTGGVDGPAALIYNTGVFNLNVSGNINLRADVGGSAFISGNADLFVAGLNNISIAGETTGFAAYMTTTAGDIDVSAAGQIVVRDNAFIDLTGGAGDLFVTTLSGDLVVENAAYLRNQVGNTFINSAANITVRSGADGDGAIASAVELTVFATGLLDIESQIGGAASLTANGDTTILSFALNMRGATALLPAIIHNTIGNMTIVTGMATLSAHSNISLLGGLGDLAVLVSEDLLVADNSAINNFSSGLNTTIAVTGTTSLLAGFGSASVFSNTANFTMTSGGRLNMIAGPFASATVFSNSVLANIIAEAMLISGDPAGFNIAQILAADGNLSLMATNNIIVRDNASVLIGAGMGTLFFNTITGDLQVDNFSTISHLGAGPIIGIGGANALVSAGALGGSSILGNDTLTLIFTGDLGIEAKAAGGALISSNGDTVIISDRLHMIGADPAIRAQILNASGNLTILTGLTTIVPHSDVFLTGGIGGYTFIASDDMILANDSFMINSATGAMNVLVAGSSALVAGVGNAIIQGVISTTNFITTKNVFILSDATGFSEVNSGSNLTVLSILGSINVNGSIAGPNIASINNATGPLTVLAANDITLQDFGSIFSMGGASPITVLATAGNLNIINSSFIQHLGTGTVTAFTGADALIKAGLQGPSFIRGNDAIAATSLGQLDILADAGGSAFIAGGNTSTVTAIGRIRIAGNSLINNAFIQTTLGDLIVTGGSYDILDFARIAQLSAVDDLTVNNTFGDFRISNASFITNLGSGITTLNIANSIFATGGADGAAALIYGTGVFNLNTTGVVSFRSDNGGGAFISGSATLNVVGATDVEIVGVATGPAAFFTTTIGDILVNTIGSITVRDNASIDLAAVLGDVTLLASNDIVIENNALVRNQGLGNQFITSTGNVAVRSGAAGSAAITGNGQLTMSITGLLDMEGQLGGSATIASNDDTLITAGQVNMRAVSGLFPSTITVGTGDFTFLAGLTTLVAHSHIQLSGGLGNYLMTVLDDLFVSNDSSLDNFSIAGLMQILVSGTANFSAGAGNASIFNNAPTFVFNVANFLNFIADPLGSATIFTNSTTATITALNMLLSGDPAAANIAQFLATGGSLSLTATHNITARDNADIQVAAGAATLSLTTTTGDINLQNAATIAHNGTGTVILLPGANMNIIGGVTGPSSALSNADLIFVAPGRLNIQAASGNTASLLANDLAILIADEVNLTGFSNAVRATINTTLGDMIMVANNVFNQLHSDIRVAGGVTGDMIMVLAGNLVTADDSTIENLATGINTTLIVGGSASFLGGSGDASLLSNAANLTLLTANNINLIANVGAASITTNGLVATITSSAGSILAAGTVGGAQSRIVNALGSLALIANDNITFEHNAVASTLAGAASMSATTILGDIQFEDNASFIHSGTGPVTLLAASNAFIASGRNGSALVSGNSTMDVTAGANLILSGNFGGTATILANGLTNVTAGSLFNMTGSSLVTRAFVTNGTGGLNIVAGEIAMTQWAQVSLIAGAPNLSMQTMFGNISMGPDTLVSSGATLGINIASAANVQMHAATDGFGVHHAIITTTNALGPITGVAAGSFLMTGDDHLFMVSSPSITSVGGAIALTSGSRFTMDLESLIQTTAGSNPITITALDGDLWMNKSSINHLGTGTISVVLIGDLVMHDIAQISGLSDVAVTAQNLLMLSPVGTVGITGRGSMNINLVDKISLAANAVITNLAGTAANLDVGAGSIITITGGSGITHAGTGNLNILGMQSMNLIGNAGDAFLSTTGGGNITINLASNLTATSNETTGGPATMASILSTGTLDITAENVFSGGQTTGAVVVPTLFSSVGNMTIITEVNALLRNGALWQVTGLGARLLIVTDNAFPAAVGPGHFSIDQYSTLQNLASANNIYVYSAAWGERGLPTDANMGNGNSNFGIFNGTRFAAFFNPIVVPAPAGGGMVNRFTVFFPGELGTHDGNVAAFLYKIEATLPPPPCPPCPPAPPCPPPSPSPCPPPAPCPPCPPSPPSPPRPSTGILRAALRDVVFASSEIFSEVNRYEWDRWGYSYLTYGYCVNGEEGDSCREDNAVLRKNFTRWPVEFKVQEGTDVDEKPHWLPLEMQQFAYENEVLLEKFLPLP